MTLENIKHNIVKAISYSRLVEETFTPGECSIVLQQWVGKGIIPNGPLRGKLVALSQRIKGWERPKLRYNESRELMVLDPESITWKKAEEYYDYKTD